MVETVDLYIPIWDTETKIDKKYLCYKERFGRTTKEPIVDTLRFDKVRIDHGRLYVHWSNVQFGVSKKLLECYVYNVPVTYMLHNITTTIPLYDGYIIANQSYGISRDDAKSIASKIINAFGNDIFL